MADYTQDIIDVQRTIAAEGETCTWIKTVQQPDNTKPWKTSADSSSPIQNTVSIVFLSPKNSGFKALVELIKGSDQLQGGRRGLMAAVNFVPNVGDKVQRASTPSNVYTVLSCDPLDVNGQIIYYDIEFAA